MSRFDVHTTPIAGVSLIERKPIGDERGFLARLFCAKELRAAGWTTPVVQINHTRTAEKGTIRGMHYQAPPSAEQKLVLCLRGTILDVAVDVRHDSPTLYRHHREELSDSNYKALLIPEGCAHGFQTLTDDCELIYLHSAPYDPAAEGGLHPLDPFLSIPWPLPVSRISERDRSHPMRSPADEGIRL